MSIKVSANSPGAFFETKAKDENWNRSNRRLTKKRNRILEKYKQIDITNDEQIEKVEGTKWSDRKKHRGR